MDFSTNVSLPWMILGDFNNVLKFDEKSNGVEMTPYEIKDFANCCQHVGLTDMRSIGCLYTWTNNSVWSKIDRAMVNDVWGQNGIYGLAEFLPSGCLFDHSPCVTFDVVGTKQFVLCKKLYNLKGALKELNAKHFGHISIRANDAKRELEAAQLRLHDQPANVHYQLMVAQLRKKAMGVTQGGILLLPYLRRMRHTPLLKIAQKFILFYCNLLGTSCPVRPIELDILKNGPLVSLEQGNSLTRDIFSQEIKEALFGIGDDKSPRPDGYTSCFFKKAWGIVGDNVVETIKEFFSSRSLLKQINHTIITLVPKSNHTPNVGDHRPISCCNVIYKVISKILASRLRPILKTIVDQAQTAFVEGKSMTENIHLAQELMRQYNRKRVAPRCLSKIDLKKAYDLVNWDFLKEVLEGLCFPSRFVEWVMECVTTLTYSVALNGSIHDFFKGKERPPTRGDIMSVQILMDCLSNFGNASGLRMNTLKSSLFTAGIHGQELEEIQALTNIPKVTMPFRYLGIPLASVKLKAELIRVVFQGVEYFWLSIFPIPATIISRIISLCRNFLWRSKKPLVAWRNVCLPKDKGGLGFRDMKSWNLALLAKTLWNILQNDTLWIGWVNQLYLKGASIWDVLLRKDDSPLIKKLLEIRDFILRAKQNEYAAVHKLSS
ncbi:uncharacterized protein LOC111397792 [Olea europaea var. sylvestris]|uniref:uncharacterized protein LOC111397792 n=1 Tax=Olea europaea var. sylvestris TaxID=158386 RepID=UPI000C1D5C8E|nr:uncharacterized protein LOC111397792 [Olea europaea var. sylvestris]